ncbi:MAG: hypothetical protein KGI88_08140 [Betaproteobacteria bacterium]|uniref:hypothetical protein n=1 Tax=Ferrovum sp. PN-J185 TaxID=1356306 RepID=UPI0007959046|nr:hypothetical protein [Ferrovum sp. PN-J185]KXW55188.1 hypothetical protein FV185_18860 [Ferrovum sp. PN-J185]MDE2057176.1 hypothetical protein [Betaproteobacteria bacterium]
MRKVQFNYVENGFNNKKLKKFNGNSISLRDSELVLYKRENSQQWQARYKLYDR